MQLRAWYLQDVATLNPRQQSEDRQEFWRHPRQRSPLCQENEAARRLVHSFFSQSDALGDGVDQNLQHLSNVS